MSKRKKILWLVSWYPNKYDPFDGDFIQRHARAAALYDDVYVFFIRFAKEQVEVEEDISGSTSLTEHILYLPKEKGIFGRIGNYRRWRHSYQSVLEKLMNDLQPAVVHVHVPWKAGLMALWLKRKFGAPYLLTEHWGIYNPVVDDHIGTRTVFFRRLLKIIFREAAGFISVSRFLGEGVNRHLLQKPFTVIPNVVDTSLFFPVEEKAARFTFLHVSNMVPLKNVGGILNAFHQFLTQTVADAQLVLVGNRDDEYVSLAQTLGLLNDSVFFRGELPYAAVAAEMQKAHVLVLISDMENSPCVIGEALCCGLPVIATEVGGIPELLSAKSSLLVPPRDRAGLVTAFLTLWAHYQTFSQRHMAGEAAARFSMPVVGQQFHQAYHNDLPPPPSA